MDTEVVEKTAALSIEARITLVKAEKKHGRRRFKDRDDAERVIKAQGAGTVIGYYEHEHLDLMVQAAAHWSGRSSGVYFIPQPINPRRPPRTRSTPPSRVPGPGSGPACSLARAPFGSKTW